MKQTLILLVLAILTLGLSVACSSGDSGPSCDEVCSKMQECAPEENYTECVSSCDAFDAVMRGEVYETMGNCFMDQTCEFLEENGDYCYEAAIAAGDLSTSRSLVERICAKAVSCAPEGTYTQQQCVDDMTGAGEGSDDLYYTLAMFKDSVLDCIGDCMEELSCSELEEGTEGCMSDCGLSFLMDDRSSSGGNSTDGPGD